MGRIYTKEILETVVKNSTSVMEVVTKLGLKKSGGNHSHIKRRILEYGINTTHFLGQASNKGKKFPAKYPIEKYLIKDIDVNSHSLKKRLITEKLKPNHCEICLLSEWHGQELPLHLDHMNMDHRDNRLSNLQILCPNCHAVKTRADRQARVAER